MVYSETITGTGTTTADTVVFSSFYYLIAGSVIEDSLISFGSCFSIVLVRITVIGLYSSLTTGFGLYYSVTLCYGTMTSVCGFCVDVRIMGFG